LNDRIIMRHIKRQLCGTCCRYIERHENAQGKLERACEDFRSFAAGAPAWMFKAFDAVLAVDIGGTNIRAGVVRLNLKKSSNLSKAKVSKYSLWWHGDEEDINR
jgi:hypothetical protein